MPDDVRDRREHAAHSFLTTMRTVTRASYARAGAISLVRFKSWSSLSRSRADTVYYMALIRYRPISGPLRVFFRKGGHRYWECKTTLKPEFQRKVHAFKEYQASRKEPRVKKKAKKDDSNQEE